MTSWRPKINQATLKERAQLLQSIRQFFLERDVMEVETPLLTSFPNFDESITSIACQVLGKPYFLQSSPEYPMKRLLAAASGSIYQICKAFRNDELGKRHNPEFTMLEWYMLDFSLSQLMDQVDELLSLCLDRGVSLRVTYQRLFEKHFAINPHGATQKQLQDLLAEHVEVHDLKSLSSDDCLNLLFASVIEPTLGLQQPCIVMEYPTSQAALAELKQDEREQQVAQRFEVYVDGLELANAYQELRDVQVLQERFADQANFNEELDQHLLAAMESGLPRCSGIALGFDRLLMLKHQSKSISQVITFDIDNC